MGVIKAAIGDGALTFLWVLCSSCIGVSTYLVATTFGVVNEMGSLFITTLVVFLIFLVFGFLGDALGGAAFNPTANAAFYAAGLGHDSLVSAALRCPAQVAGAVAGSLAIMELMPKQYHHMLEGPALKVDVQAGAIAEGVLTFIITFMVFVIVLRGPKSALLKNWLLTLVTVPLVVAGSNYTGPSMNPANVVPTNQLWTLPCISKLKMTAAKKCTFSSISVLEKRQVKKGANRMCHLSF
ncbi:aquaporin SIP1-2-like isoform X3 [Nicotiana tomentosiformis]|uniref:Aquaporin SIP1-2 isoform X1 n=1 Tax=Nicotiana tabacum TaxID=4097 RepID=A0A1S3XIC6_TOBAC|nr:PREDICTED: aquaporin SIP1-2-like isoform X1 [Nicotiana tabacum]XP_018627941.1 aquaporin SIP1-2-like isoform X1 [Nicotiana tomentosiformis]